MWGWVVEFGDAVVPLVELDVEDADLADVAGLEAVELGAEAGEGGLMRGQVERRAASSARRKMSSASSGAGRRKMALDWAEWGAWCFVDDRWLDAAGRLWRKRTVETGRV